MHKMVLALGLVWLAAGCHDELSGDYPPAAYMASGDKKQEGVQGSYCWKGTCADMVGPVELMEGHPPVIVKPGERIKFTVKYNPQPNEFHLVLFQGEKMTEVNFDGQETSAPDKEGIYQYAYSVWWMDKEVEHLSHGDSAYAFSIKVEK